MTEYEKAKVKDLIKGMTEEELEIVKQTIDEIDNSSQGDVHR